ncbi:MAG: 8-oxo-dGTP diphosphatase [Spirochaetales bacterium]|nr:8-oxo-dGTP diphosphatase [Spirochaetales bacterium]
MLSLILQRPAAAVLIAVLIFSMTQRKNKRAGERKRIATLYLAAIFAFFYFSLIYFYRNNMSDYLIAVSGGICLAAVVLFRKKIFIWRNRCVDCGAKVGLYKAFYVDHPRCENCAKMPGLGKKAVIKHKPVKSVKGGIIASDVDQIDWKSWQPDEKAVLCFIRRKDEVLLIHKKTGLGTGKINAPGGRIDQGESEVEAAVREVREEVLLDIEAPDYAGELYFQFIDGYKLHCTVFTTNRYSGMEQETYEAAPFWCKTDAIPFDKMWEDDRHWVPLMLEGKKFTGYYIFKDDVMLSKRLVL